MWCPSPGVETTGAHGPRQRRPAVADANNNRIVKRRVSDLTCVAEQGTGGTGNDQLVGPLALTTDGTHLYVADRLNSRIVKRWTAAP